MQIIEFLPNEIKVREGMERFRKEIGDVTSLADSIQRVGQILPVVITRDLELIDGGRRLAACLLKGLKVKCVYKDCIDDVEMRELEIEANCHRKDFTPAEKAAAIEEFQRLKQLRHGAPIQGSKNSGWTSADTAKALGVSRGTVEQALQISEMVKAFPELKAATKSSQILKAAKGLQRIAETVVTAKALSKEAISRGDQFQLHFGDAVEHMRSLETHSVNILLTDPIYGINADQTAISLGGETGGEITSQGFKISDKKKDAFYYYKVLAKESFRFCREDAHGYVFVGPEHQWLIKKIFERAGWRVYVKPIIWIKREVGQNNAPGIWPSSCYEMLLYIRRDKAYLVKQGMPDWVECPPVSSSNKIHPFEKPVLLLHNLLSRVCFPGQVMYDPFCGSASSLEAALMHRLYPIGVDNSQESHLLAKKRIIDFLAKKEV